jgi:undecaprenyl-diphosphatase
MNIFQSIILGLVQGLTEFIPVSSTGHLILARKMLGLDLVGSLSFDAILQLATGLAVLLYFWRDLWNIIKNRNIKLIGILILGTIPAVTLGLFLQDYMDTAFRGTGVVALALIAGAVLFYFAEKWSRQKNTEHNRPLAPSLTNEGGKSAVEIPEISSERLGTPLSGEDFSGVSFKKGFFVGLFQCLALIPGFSRSGSTISGGLFMGLDRETATRFSFLLSLPIIFGSGLKKIFDLYQTGALAQVESSLFIASLFAFISGLLAIHYLLKFIKNHSLNYFGVYRIILAIVILIWL